MIHRGINHANVLIVTNASSSLSRDVADMYRALRGLGQHELSMPMPTSATMTWAQARDVVLAVNAYIRSHDISAVIVSADVPCGVVMPYVVKITVSTISLDNLLSWAWYVGEYGLDTPSQRSVGYGAAMLDAPYRLTSLQDTPYNILHKTTRETETVTGYRDLGYGSELQINGSWQSLSTIQQNYFLMSNRPVAIQPQPAYKRLPFGRIGFGRRHVWLPADTLAGSQRMVEDAIAAEQSSLPISSRIVHVAATTLTGSYPPYDDLAGVMLRDSGYVVRYLGSGVPAVTYDYSYPSPPQSLKTLHGYLGLAPNLSESAFSNAANRFDYQQGAWVIGGLSFGLSEWGVRALVDGACSAIGTVFEPYADALMQPTWTTAKLLSGQSMAEIAATANYRNDYTWQLSAWGDPLYRPFPAVGVPDGESSSISVVTPERSAALSTPARAATLSTEPLQAANITPARTATWQS